MRIPTRDQAAFSIPHSEFRAPHSKGFTLIELLVAMAIIVLLMGLVLAFYPKREVRYAAQGADQLQTYIAAAKARALRDQAPRGIRLIANPGEVGFREFQYIEQPEPYAPVGVTMTITRTDPGRATFSVNMAGLVQGGDLLEITHGVGSIHRVAPNGVIGNQVFFVGGSTVPAASNSNLVLTSNYRFIRQPRPLLGETVLHLPDKVYVNVNGGAPVPSQNIPFNSWTNNFDIIFSPSGQVINANAGRIVLAVLDDNNVSKPTLLCVYAYTGAVGAHPLDANGGDSFTRDGQGSGQ